jgi:osmotically-inducible protein OsmY
MAVMKKVSWLIPLLFGLNVLFAGCDRAGQSGKHTNRSPSSTSQLSDSDLEQAVWAKLETDPQLESADLGVNADAARNEVTLSGTVCTRAEREKAIDLARSAKPGVLVNNKIDVKPGA